MTTYYTESGTIIRNPEAYARTGAPMYKNNNNWKIENLCDCGWGNEYGFIRLPEPNFEELWTLLTESKIYENKLGAAELLNQNYTFEKYTFSAF